MSVVGVTAGVAYGPWRIPTRAQNMVISHYAADQGLALNYLFEEGVYYDQYPRLRELLENRDIAHLIFCSVHQLPKDRGSLLLLADRCTKTIIHFAIENRHGAGKEFLVSSFDEMSVFIDAETMLTSPRQPSYREFEATLTQTLRSEPI